MKTIFTMLMILAVTLLVSCSTAHKPRTLVIKEGQFVLDNEPIQFLCGELHYPRIPRELWRDRMKRAKAMGINCISAYVFWSFHEREEGVFDFTGNADIAEFCRIAQEEDLLVFLRPGPYVCAEFDFGGYPSWLQNYKDLKWRSKDPQFMKLMKAYIERLAVEVKDLQISNGGPICLVQVENEYGFYGDDKEYLRQTKEIYQNAGFNVTLTTCDGGGQMHRGFIEGCFPCINGAFGDDIFRFVDKFQKGGPYFVAEFYPAWFDVWGRRHSRKDKDVAAKQLDWMLAHDVSVSIYMFHGGTNFWYTNGANNPPYAPQPTSYDYDAPLGEYGNMTPKYFAFRDVVLKNLPEGKTLPPVPPQPKIVTVDQFELTQSAPLSVALPKAVKSKRPLTMEKLGMDMGYVLYRTTITKPVKGLLVCKELRDFGVVMVDGKPVGQMDRRHKQNSIKIDIKNVPATLEILVENVGRVNFGGELLHNFKGITETVLINDEEILGWENFILPLYKEDVFAYDYGKNITGIPAFHRGTFDVKETGEIFLDLGKWGKGAVWVNGKSLGKFWSIGPQQTMYLPSCWVKEGKNEIVVLDIDDRGTRAISGLAQPVLDTLQDDKNLPAAKERDGDFPWLDKGDMVAKVEFIAGKEPQTVKFKNSLTARHICLEILNSHGDQPYSHIAEIDILDGDGKIIPKDRWKIWYANTEELSSEDGKAENIIDGKTNTHWHSRYGGMPSKYPHIIVIDTNTIGTISGLIYTGRNSSVGGVKDVKIYARPQFFLNK